MISVLICSVDEKRLARVSQNIAETIGAEYELIVADNRGTGKGLCKVYNELAAKAKGEVLCFVHEDVLFLRAGWGKLLSDKAAEPNTGIIGAVGCAMKTRTLSGMMQNQYGEIPLITCREGETPQKGPQQFSRSGLDWAPVIIVDGVLLFMRRNLWEQFHFDEETFKGFHLYDMDLSTQVATSGYTNYICNRIEMAHFTRGNYKNGWYEDTLKYHKKWKQVLPLYVNRPSNARIRRDERYMFYNITYLLLKRSNRPPVELWKRIRKQLHDRPLHHKSYYHLYRYLRYAMQYKLS